MFDVYAKSALTKDEISVKQSLGCDGIEIQLLDELIDQKIGFYNSANKVFDLNLYENDNIKAVHAPILSHFGLSDVNLETLCCDTSIFLLDQIFYIANYFGEKQNSTIRIIIHSENNLKNIKLFDGLWDSMKHDIKYMLRKYPYTILCIENVTPIRAFGTNNIHLCNNFKFDNVEIVKALREELQTDRICTVLDTCHAMITNNVMTAIYNSLDSPSEDYSLDAYFNANKDVIGLIHLADCVGNGYGKGKHGVTFTPATESKLKNIIDLYNKYNYNCPITLEVAELDYLICNGYKQTKAMVDKLNK